MAELFPPIKGVLTTDIPEGQSDPKPEWLGKFILHTRSKALYFYAEDGSSFQVANRWQVGEVAYDFGVIAAKALLSAATGNKDVDMLKKDISSLKEQREANLKQISDQALEIESKNKQLEALGHDFREIQAQIQQMQQKATEAPAYTMSVQDPAELSAANHEIRFLRLLITKLMSFNDNEMKRVVELELI